MRLYLLVLVVAVLALSPLRAQERLVLQERSPGQVVAMRYSPDGSHLAVCFRNDLAVRVYPVAGGPPAVIPAGHDGLVCPVFTPDGRALVCRTPQGVSVHDATTGRERLALTDPGEGGFFAVSRDGRTLAVATGRGTLRLYDFATFEERRTLQRGGGFVVALALSGDGHTLATVHLPGVVQVRKDGKEWDRFDFGGESRSQLWRLTFSPDGSILAVTHSGRTALRDLAGHKSLGEFPGELAAFTPDGKAVAALEGKTIRIRDLAGRPLRTVPLPAARKQVLELLLGADGRSCVISFGDGEVVLREVPAGDAGPDGRSVVLRKTGAAGPLALTPDGRTALLAGADGRLHFHDIDARSEKFGQELAAEAPAVPAQRVTGLVVAPDGRRAAVLLEGGTGRLWDVSTRREVGGELTLPPTPMAFAFNGDGSVVSAVSAGRHPALEGGDRQTARAGAGAGRAGARGVLARVAGGRGRLSGGLGGRRRDRRGAEAARSRARGRRPLDLTPGRPWRRPRDGESGRRAAVNRPSHGEGDGVAKAGFARPGRGVLARRPPAGDAALRRLRGNLGYCHGSAGRPADPALSHRLRLRPALRAGRPARCWRTAGAWPSSSTGRPGSRWRWTSG